MSSRDDVSQAATQSSERKTCHLDDLCSFVKVTDTEISHNRGDFIRKFLTKDSSTMNLPKLAVFGLDITMVVRVEDIPKTNFKPL